MQWFKVQLLARRVYDRQERHTFYTSGPGLLETKTALQAQHVGWIVKIKPISYEDILKQTKCPRSFDNVRVDI